MKKTSNQLVSFLVVIVLLALLSFLGQHDVIRRSSNESAALDTSKTTLTDFATPSVPHKSNSKTIYNTSNFRFPLEYHSCSVKGRNVSIPIVPQFIVAGAQKGGTTALFYFLRSHPNLASSNSLEAHYFDWIYPSEIMKPEWLEKHNYDSLDEEEWRCALFEDYAKYFPTDRYSNVKYFEKTPSYMFLTRVPQLIATTSPKPPKIVLVLRNPVDRAFSHYRMTQLRKPALQGKPLEDFIDKEVNRFRTLDLLRVPLRQNFLNGTDRTISIPTWSVEEEKTLHWKHYRYISSENFIQRGMYVVQLRYWMRYFRLGESLKVIPYERFLKEPDVVFQDLLRFVGVPPFQPPDGYQTEFNTNNGVDAVLANETREYLSAIFRPYNEMLADVLGEEWRGIWDS
eukprot:Nitzschia sp. Nitz4//scaffold13_size275219//238326//239519//NITZ4_000920-RA/size275219-processed-gene-0.111-mRNA-1//1//CDS//3329536152//4521//frame0